MARKPRHRRHPGSKRSVSASRDESGIVRVRLDSGPNWTGWLSLALALAGLLSQWFGR